jgi:uncharacterized membrane protein YGL010W
MNTIHDWLNEYGESHKNETNKLIHWICVPSIYFSIVGLLYCIKLPFELWGVQINVAFIVTLMVLLYYVKLSKSLMIGMLCFSCLCLFLSYLVEKSGFISLWLFSIIFFSLAWLGQFYGHKIEGKKPSFLKDIQFLMIGPAWLMSFIYKKAGISL